MAKTIYTGRGTDNGSRVILLVESNPSDTGSIVRALRKPGARNRVHAAKNEVQAMKYLREEGTHRGAGRPSLILLEPGKRGYRLLVDCKADPRLRSIPVVVLTYAAVQPEEIGRAYGLGASCCIPKPRDAKQLAEVMTLIRHFWFDVARLPSAGSHRSTQTDRIPQG